MWFRGINSRDSTVGALSELHMTPGLFQRSLSLCSPRSPVEKNVSKCNVWMYLTYVRTTRLIPQNQIA